MAPRLLPIKAVFTCKATPPPPRFENHLEVMPATTLRLLPPPQHTIKRQWWLQHNHSNNKLRLLAMNGVTLWIQQKDRHPQTWKTNNHSGNFSIRHAANTELGCLQGTPTLSFREKISWGTSYEKGFMTSPKKLSRCYRASRFLHSVRSFLFCILDFFLREQGFSKTAFQL